jgi:hypothetical protein
MHVSLFLGENETVEPVIADYLNELDIDLEVIHVAEALVSRDYVLSRCNRSFVRVLERSDHDDVFYLDADCYFRCRPTWDRIEGDVIFGSVEKPQERAAQAFPAFCSRLRAAYFGNRQYFGSCVYVRGPSKILYAQILKNLLQRNMPFQYFDDMHYRLMAAMLSGLRYTSAPKELEYKVVFDDCKTNNPEMLHLCFSLDWYRRDRCYPWFLTIIADFTARYPALTPYLHPIWIEHCSKIGTAGQLF